MPVRKEIKYGERARDCLLQENPGRIFTGRMFRADRFVRHILQNERLSVSLSCFFG